MDIFLILEDNKTQFISISIEHQSPYIAKKWLDIVIENINESMRDNDAKKALSSIDFLQNSLKETKIKEIKDAVTQLLEDQIQALMFASANKDYIYKIIDLPIVPEKKSDPSRLIICLLGAILGCMIGISLSLFLNAVSVNKTTKKH